MVDIIKLDVEGAELAAVNDPETLQWLVKYVKVLLFEWHPHAARSLVVKAIENLRSRKFYTFYNEFRLQGGTSRFLFPVQSFISCQ